VVSTSLLVAAVCHGCQSVAHARLCARQLKLTARFITIGPSKKYVHLRSMSEGKIEPCQPQLLAYSGLTFFEFAQSRWLELIELKVRQCSPMCDIFRKPWAYRYESGCNGRVRPHHTVNGAVQIRFTHVSDWSTRFYLGRR
jgi:hypothetical protein